MKSNNIIKNLFKESNNTLGILMRGTDYIARKHIFIQFLQSQKWLLKILKYLIKKINMMVFYSDRG